MRLLLLPWLLLRLLLLLRREGAGERRMCVLGVGWVLRGEEMSVLMRV